MKINHVYLDLDGVLVDWFGGVCELTGRDRHRVERYWPEGATTEDALRVDVNEMWELINQRGSDWWANLQPLPWVAELLLLFSERPSFQPEVSILTSPANSVYAATGKLQWVREHLPGLFERVHLTADKHLLARPGALLVDDNDDNCRRFEEGGGVAILFPQPWNPARLIQDLPVKYLKRQLLIRGIIS